MTSFFSSTLFGQAAEATHTAPLPTGTMGSMPGSETRESTLLPAGPVSVPKASVADADESTPDDSVADDPVPLIVSDILYPAPDPAPEPSIAREKSPVKTYAPVADMADKEAAEQDEAKNDDTTDDKGGDPGSIEEIAEDGDNDDDKDNDKTDDSDDSDGDSSIADYRASPEPESIPVQPWPTPRGIKRKATGALGSATPAGKRGRPAKAAKTAAATPTIKKKPGRKPGRPVGRSPAVVRKSDPAPPAALSGRQASLAAKKLMEAPVPKRAAAAAAKAALVASAAARRTRKPSGEASKAAVTRSSKGRGAKTAAAKTADTKKTPAKKPAAKTAVTKAPKSGASSKGSADDEPEEYVVESIVGTRLNGKTKEMEYNIKWAGYPKSQNTWEPRDNLTGCEKLLRTFEKARRTTKKK